MHIPFHTAVGQGALAALLLLPGPGGDAFLAAPQPGAPVTGQPAAVQALFRTHQCGSCHQLGGVEGAAGTLAPALRQWGRRSYIAGELPNTPALLALWITDAPALLPGTRMPALGVPPRDAARMAAYLLAQR